MLYFKHYACLASLSFAYRFVEYLHIVVENSPSNMSRNSVLFFVTYKYCMTLPIATNFKASQFLLMTNQYLPIILFSSSNTLCCILPCIQSSEMTGILYRISILISHLGIFYSFILPFDIDF